MTLIGAILCYRSIVRLGSGGVGGANPSMIMAKVISVDDSGPIQRMSIGVDEETRKSIRQANIDSKAGVIGAVLTIVGTLIWGYGDLLGRVL